MTSPNLILYLAAGLLAGISVAGVMVLLLQMLGGGIENDDAIQRKLGFASLGMIPDAKSLPGYRKTGLPAPPIELVVDRPQSAFTESLWSLRTSILSAPPNLTHAPFWVGMTTSVRRDQRMLVAAAGGILAATAIGMAAILYGDRFADIAVLLADSGSFIKPPREFTLAKRQLLLARAHI